MFDPNLHPLSTSFIGGEKLRNKFGIPRGTTGSITRGILTNGSN